MTTQERTEKEIKRVKASRRKGIRGVFSADPTSKGRDVAKCKPCKPRSNPMPEWAIEEARFDARRQKSKGRKKPMLTLYSDWPEARAAYLKEFAA